MEVSYIRDYNFQYLVIKTEKDISRSYQVSMLLQNHIPGFLPMHLQDVDGESGICYEITSLEPLTGCFASEKISREEISFLLLCFCHAVQEVNQYLLKGECILLNPEYIFAKKDMEEIFFCYYPQESSNIKDNLNCLCRFILDHIDYDDRDCVKMAYALFQESLRDSVSIASIAGCLQEEGETKETEVFKETEEEMPEGILKPERHKKGVQDRKRLLIGLFTGCLVCFFGYEVIQLSGKLMLLEEGSQGLLIAAAVTAAVILTGIVVLIYMAVRSGRH